MRTERAANARKRFMVLSLMIRLLRSDGTWPTRMELLGRYAGRGGVSKEICRGRGSRQKTRTGAGSCATTRRGKKQALRHRKSEYTRHAFWEAVSGRPNEA